uniref:Uncharacterized protein n=1 Tax=Terrapene triunguis TaxID=2587831 RepID=A0A674JXJ5_9SAUR
MQSMNFLAEVLGRPDSKCEKSGRGLHVHLSSSGLSRYCLTIQMAHSVNWEFLLMQAKGFYYIISGQNSTL